MRAFKLNIIAVCSLILLLNACKKEKVNREVLPEDSVTFDLPASTEVVTIPIEIKNIRVASFEIKASIQGTTSSDIHYVTFGVDTTKIAAYRSKYGNSALLLPLANYIYYKPTVAISPGTSVSEAAVLNLNIQTSFRPHSTYVLPLVISAVDGQPQNPATRRVIYYVFNTGDPLYVDHTGYTLTATASSTLGANIASRAIDATTGTTFWASSNTVPLPQFVSIDLARNVSFSGLDYFFPTGVSAAIGGLTTSAKVETSLDNINWVDNGTYNINLNNSERKHTINLSSPTTGRYLRFTILSANPYVASPTITYNIGLVGGILLRN